ncbi:MAG: DciA family protein [Patescibacteria group bacterium]
MIDSLKNLLNRKIRATGGGLGERIKASVVVSIIDAAIAGIHATGAAVKARTFRDGIVTVSCEAAVDAQEIRLKESEIIAEANRRLGSGTVKKLRVTC